MNRRKMSPEERKNQIIKTALELFKDKGYEDTPVSSIIEEAGISKGGFYHHYKSKEELLEDIAALFVDQVLGLIRKIVQREELSALEKLNSHIREVNALKKEKSAEVFIYLAELYAGGKNLQLERLIFDCGREKLAPLIKEIIEQGWREGDFKTDYPEEAAEIYVRLFLIHQREISELMVRALETRDREKFQEIMNRVLRKYSFLQKVLEDVLGLPGGSLVLEEVARDTITYLGRQVFPDLE